MNPKQGISLLIGVICLFSLEPSFGQSTDKGKKPKEGGSLNAQKPSVEGPSVGDYMACIKFCTSIKDPDASLQCMKGCQSIESKSLPDYSKEKKGKLNASTKTKPAKSKKEK